MGNNTSGDGQDVQGKFVLTENNKLVIKED